MKGWLRIAAAETRAELLKTVRMPAFVIPTLALPLLFYLIFGILLSLGPGMDRHALAGYGAFGVIGPALFGFGVGIATERSAGWMLLKQASPLPLSAWLVARTLVAMSFAGGVVLGLFALAAGGAGVRLAGAAWLQLAVVLVAGVVPFCGMGLAIGLAVRGSAASAVVNLLYLPMSALSGLWFPLQLFPELLERLAWALPPFHLGQLALKAVGLDAGFSAGWHAAALAGFTLLFAGLAHSAYRSDHAVLATA